MEWSLWKPSPTRPKVQDEHEINKRTFFIRNQWYHFEGTKNKIKRKSLYFILGPDFPLPILYFQMKLWKKLDLICFCAPIFRICAYPFQKLEAKNFMRSRRNASLPILYF